MKRLNAENPGKIDSSESSGLHKNMNTDSVADIFSRLVTPDPVKTAAELGRFEKAGREARQMLKDGPTGDFKHKLNRLGTSASRLFENVVPRDDQAVTPPRLKSVIPIIDFQTSQRRTKLVDQVLHLPEQQKQAEALQLLKEKLGLFDANDKNRLIDHALHLFDRADHSDDQGSAAEFLVCAQNFLSDVHRSRIDELRSGDGNHEDLYWNIEHDFKNSQSQETRSSNNPATRNDTELGELEAAVLRITSSNIVSDGKLGEVEKVSERLAESYQRLRQELYSTDRSRNNSSRAG
ncbi:MULTISPECIES: hypothetical protein [Rhizobium]|uniref:Uncharacterized protein n=1 Tax=Rhizobium rhododendri TaxID=2506430 RepID=A0ABY8IRP5_9HYPH|nr:MULTISPECIES: hypothetical protein [Rhizobium]TQX81309.1 hypothetical protein EQW76_28495 [Rhizobium sp. rho-13.1]TQY04968.1 hypothetical protein EQW74_27795 [Rhizobium sp. rho-1.1]WFS26384.1 hypothetical protein PR018_25590 [Rhizobium rhododendri]